MRFLRTFFFVVFPTVLFPNFVHAHAGHVGELAGHAHWIGLAAGLGAAGLLGLLIKHKGKKDNTNDEDVTAEDAESDAAEEASA